MKLIDEILAVIAAIAAALLSALPVFRLEPRKKKKKHKKDSREQTFIAMDPTIFISGLSGLLQAIETWVTYRDSKRAASALEAQSQKAKQDSAIVDEAKALESIVPPDVLEKLIERATTCWKRYEEVLGGEFLPAEIDEATMALKKCICRELRRILELNGSIPPGVLRRWWEQYCQSPK